MDRETTTITIYKKDLPTWKRCCGKKEKGSQDTFNDLMNSIDSAVKYKRYVETLATRDDYKRPLSGIKIDKCKDFMK